MRPFTAFRYIVLLLAGSACTFQESGHKTFTSFGFDSPPVCGTIDQSARSITLSVPNWTDLSALVASFETTGGTVNVGSKPQVSGITANDFSKPVTYTVTAVNGTIKQYQVSVNPAAVRAQWARSTTVAPSYATFTSVAVDNAGNAYAVGYQSGQGQYEFGGTVTAKGTGNSGNCLLVKYDSSGTAQWARSVSAGSNLSRFFAVTVDVSGNVYAAGTIGGTDQFDLGDSVTISGKYPSGDNAVLVKYSASGVTQWARTVSVGPNASSFYSLAVGSNGEIFAAGTITGTTQFNFGGSATVTGTYASGLNSVLVKYDSSGTAQWARSTTTGSGYSGFTSVAVNGNGYVYAAGEMNGAGPFSFGNSINAVGPFASGRNAVLVAYNSEGEAQWASTPLSASAYSYFNAVTSDGRGNIYIAGNVDLGTFDFGNGSTVTGLINAYNFLLVKFDSMGRAQWARSCIAADNFSACYSLKNDSSGNIIVAGDIRGTVAYDFGNSVTVKGAYADLNVLLTKYDSSGRALWARSVSAGSSHSRFKSVAIDGLGAIYAVGDLYDACYYEFGDSIGISSVTAGVTTPLIVKYY
jgi:outer membrane protein assembly factor BamB